MVGDWTVLWRHEGQVNIAGSGTTASPFVYSIGLPRTVRAGIEAFRW
jgi:hypothetical protein